MAQSLIKLHSLGMLGHTSNMFGCTIDGKQYKVVPQAMYNKQDQPGIPVRVKGIRHVVYSVYSTFVREYELFLYAAIGPYKGYKGPKVSSVPLEVTLKDFGDFFSFCMWKRKDDSTVVAVQVKCNDPTAVALYVDHGYVYDYPVDLAQPVAVSHE